MKLPQTIIIDSLIVHLQALRFLLMAPFSQEQLPEPVTSPQDDLQWTVRWGESDVECIAIHV